MPFEALAYAIPLQLTTCPQSGHRWSFLLIPICRSFHFFISMCWNDLGGHCPAHRDRAFGVHTVCPDRLEHSHPDCADRLQQACGRRATSGAFLDVRSEVAHRIGLSDRVLEADINGLFPADSPYANRVPVLREMWHHVVDRGYGRALPFGRLWIECLDLLVTMQASTRPRADARPSSS